MCLWLFKRLGFFEPELNLNDPLPPNATSSLYDELVRMDHHYDAALIELHQKIKFSPLLKPFNPPPHLEKQAYDHLSPIDQGNMMQRNFLLQQRVFIYNAKAMDLMAQFSEHTTINILDIGSGFAKTLPALIVLFKKAGKKIQYTGIDIDPLMILETKNMYDGFQNVSFECKDALKLKSKAQYDLILIQHPDIENNSNTFEKIFKHAENLLNPNGIIYATFFYDHEYQYFKNWNMKGQIQPSNAFEFFKLMNRHTNALYAPESYLYMSPPKQLSLEMKKNF